MLWKSGNFKQQNFTWKTESSEIDWKLKRNLQSKNWEVERIIVFEILETQCHLLKLRKKWSKSNELCLQKKDKKWYWPSFNFETETKTFNEGKVLTEASDLIARWKILIICTFIHVLSSQQKAIKSILEFILTQIFKWNKEGKSLSNFETMFGYICKI